MSEQTPYELLGVPESASFDEIQEAKKRLMTTVNQEDGSRVEAIEAAYDAVLMHRLRMRQEGKIKVPERIRFPERTVPPVVKSEPVVNRKLPPWMQQLVDQPTPRDILLPAGVALALVGVSLFYPNLERGGQQLLLAIAWGSAIFFVNRKEGRFGRAVLMTFLGLVGGLLVGTLLAIPLQSMLLTTVGITIDQFSVLMTLIVLWAVSSFLK